MLGCSDVGSAELAFFKGDVLEIIKTLEYGYVETLFIVLFTDWCYPMHPGGCCCDIKVR